MLSWDWNEIRGDDWEFAEVVDFSEFNEFDCGDRDLNDFIHNDAPVHRDALIAETYSFKFVDEQGRKTAPVAFVSLLNDSVPLTTNKQRKKIPNDLRKYKQ